MHAILKHPTFRQTNKIYSGIAKNVFGRQRNNRIICKFNNYNNNSASNFNTRAPVVETSTNMIGVEGPYNSYPVLGAYKPAAMASVVDGMPRYPSLTSAAGMLRGSDYFGTIIFAVSGSITAGSCGLDVFGCSVIGTITAIGGGTIRDAIILHKQPFWVNEVEYFYMAFLTAFFTFFAWPLIPDDTKMIKDKNGGEGFALWFGDAIGVAAFTIIGAMNACRMCVHPGLAIVAGTVTATFGGLTRDVICGLPSSNSRGRILHSDSDIYASTAAIGASSYMIMRHLKCSMAIRLIFGLGSTIGARYLAKVYGLGLPTWKQMDMKITKEKNRV